MQKSLILCLFLITLFSCSKEEAELTLEEKVVGNWSGIITQEDCCTFKIDVRINELIANKNAASGNYYDTDYAICDDNIFFCDEANAEPSNCGFNWVFKSSSTTSVTLEETPTDLDACAPGTITLRIINDDMISYNWTDIEDPTNVASGTLSKQ